MTPPSSGAPGAGDREPTLSDDPARRASEAELRSADERVRHSDPAVRARLRRRRRRTNRIYLGLGLVVAVLLVGYVALYFLPVLAVRSVEVEGATTVSADQIVAKAAVAQGSPLLQVDTHQVARRIAGIPQVDEVTVSRDYPSTLRIDVVERTALVSVDMSGWPGSDGKTHLLDSQGVDFGTGDVPEGTPILTVGDDVRSDLPAVVRDLGPVLDEVRGTAGQQVTKIDVPTRADIRLTLGDGRTVEWGAVGRDHEKAVALQMVLGQPGGTWNVSNPALPTSR